MATDLPFASGADATLLGNDELEDQVVTLRCTEQMTTRAIADKLGVTEAKARRLLRRGLADYVEPAVEEMRAVEGAKLDAIEAALIDRVREGHLPSIDRALTVIRMRSQLFGLVLPPPVPVKEEEGERPTGAKVLDVTVWQSGRPAGQAEAGALPAPGAGVEES